MKYTNVKFEGIDFNDYPDYCDAFIVSAELNGIPLNDEQIEDLNDNDFVKYELLTQFLS
jgi:hypothetical protein